MNHGGRNGGSRAEFFNEIATIDVTTGAPFRHGVEERYNCLNNSTRGAYGMGTPEEDEQKVF